MFRHPRCLAVSVSVLLVSLAGCGTSGPAKFPVEGTILYDDKPLPSGNITLMPVEAGLAPDAAEIVNGKFTVLSTPGKRRVEIRANRDKPGNAEAVKTMGVPVEREQYIPAKYNEKSEWTVDVQPGGVTKFDGKIPK